MPRRGVQPTADEPGLSEESDAVDTSWVSLRPELAEASDFRSPLTIDAALKFACTEGEALPRPGEGSSRSLWEILATIASADLGAVRAIEPHLDALAILHQASDAGYDVPVSSGTTWGVFAAEGPGDPLRAEETTEGWILLGTKSWCSLADRLSSALVTATLPDGNRQLFAVDLEQEGVSVSSGTWHARGLTEVPSGPVHFLAVAGLPVGPAGWYLERPGFAWGGIAVAACWHGGAVGIARAVFAALCTTSPGPLQLAQLGAIDELLENGRRALNEAAAMVDDEGTSRAVAALLAKRVRATVARSCEEILTRAGHALGPAPLALDADYAKRAADLHLYIRQHHAEKDQASLGSSLLASGSEPW